MTQKIHRIKLTSHARILHSVGLVFICIQRSGNANAWSGKDAVILLSLEYGDSKLCQL
jgi:hypothetical protein